MRHLKLICRKIILNITFVTILTLSTRAVSGDVEHVTPENFFAKNPTAERKAIVDFITNQFESSMSSGISQAELDKLWNNLEARNALNLIRFQIIDQKLYADSFNTKDYYYIPLRDFFSEVVKKIKVNNVDFIIIARDEIYQDQISDKSLLDIPSFMMFRDNQHPYEKNKFLITEGFIVKNDFSDILKSIDEANKINDWNNKIDKIFWRGSFTGQRPFTLERISKLPRTIASTLTKLYPNSIDSVLVNYPNDEPETQSLKEYLKILSLVDEKERAEPKDHLKYKYLLSMDGFSSSGTRPVWIMYSNSALIKQETSKMEWFYPALKAYIHYIPTTENLSDILVQLSWAKKHDQEVRNITQNARNFVKNELMLEHIEAHAAIILNEYSKLHKNKKIKPTLPAME